ncbi:MAG: hypothetical protein WC307_01530 [Candidatus Nanoarchaeia archaeon]
MNKLLISSLLLGALFIMGCTSQAGNTDCTPDWSCTNWSECSNELKTRDCTDLNECGVNTSKPLESADCSNLPSWIGYNFNGGEHLEYSLILNATSGLKTGSLIWDVGEKSGDDFAMTFNITIDEYNCLATINAPANDISSLQQAFMTSPTCILGFSLLSMTLYSPQWSDVASRGYSSWSYSYAGHTYGFTVSDQARTYAGVSCVEGTIKLDDVDALTLCGSDLLGIGLKTTYLNPETGGLMYDAELTGFSQ